MNDRIEFQKEWIETFSAVGDLNEEELLEFYRRTAIVNKEQLLAAIVVAKQECCRGQERSDVFKSQLDALFDRFYEDIKGMYIMEIKDDWWGYGISVRETGIALQIEHYQVAYDITDFDIKAETYDVEPDLAVDQHSILHTTKAKLLPLEEYGALYGVESGTVRQWIRRGKIRGAIKAGRDWRIPELCEKPMRNYMPASYQWDPSLVNEDSEYPFMKEFDTAMFFAPQRDKIWRVSLSCHLKEDGIRMLELDSSAKEKLELYFISDPVVECTSNYIGEFRSRA